MSELSFMEKLLDGVEVEWKALGEVGEFIRGNGMQKKDFVEEGFPAIHYGQIYTKYGLSAERTFTYVPNELAVKLKKANKNDLLLATTSENDEDVVKPLAWLGDDAAISGDMMLFRHGQNVKYLAHFFQTNTFQEQKRKYITGAKVRRVSSGDLAKIPVPIPCPNNPKKSLAIQAEIVRILDAFTAMTAELTAELTARKKQYNYYRDKLLSFEEGEGVKPMSIGEIYDFQYGKGNTIPKEGGQYPVYGSNGVVGTHHEYNSEDSPVIGHIGAYAGIVNWGKGKHFVTYNGVICKHKSKEVHPQFAYYILLAQDFGSKAKNSSQPFVSYETLKEPVVLIPSLAEQARIVAILDKFDALTSSITEGLPREIELRQKQYEYYRDLLLSFPKPGAEVAA